jgi:hypothetical protein
MQHIKPSRLQRTILRWSDSVAAFSIASAGWHFVTLATVEMIDLSGDARRHRGCKSFDVVASRAPPRW